MLWVSVALIFSCRFSIFFRGENIKIKNDEFILMKQLFSGDKVLVSSWNSIQILSHSCTHLCQMKWVPGCSSVRWKRGFQPCYVLKEKNAKRISLSLCHWIFYLCVKPRICMGSYAYVWLSHLKKVLFLCDGVWLVCMARFGSRSSQGFCGIRPGAALMSDRASSKENPMLAKLSLWVMLVVPLW